MFYFLRKIRNSLIKSGAVNKYLIYAIGEIVLVVLGILIALQINNWNEGKKNEATVHVLMTQVLEEIEMNIKECHFVFTMETKRDSALKKIVNRKLTEQSYKDDPTLGSTIIYMHDIDTEDRAFQNLSRQSELIPNIYQEIFQSLEVIYNDPIQEVDKWNQILSENSIANSYNWSRTKPWYSIVSKDGYSSEATAYFLEDPIYLNEVSLYEGYFFMQRHTSVRFINRATKVYIELFKTLYPSSNLPDWTSEMIANYSSQENAY